MYRTAEVRLSGQTVGFIEEVQGGTSFAYTAAWLARPDAEPVSLTMPLRAEPYTYAGLHPFFDNLLPEDLSLHLVCREFKLSMKDRFGIMLVACADCKGAVEILPIASTIKEWKSPPTF